MESNFEVSCLWLFNKSRGFYHIEHIVHIAMCNYVTYVPYVVKKTLFH
jgi:hypothetical protein